MKDIVETIGKCVKCGVKDTLGDGLCVYCWDDIPRPKKRKPETRRIKRVIKYWQGDTQCRYCGSTRVIKHGHYYHKWGNGQTQYYWCKACESKWKADSPFGYRYSIEHIRFVLLNKVDGLSEAGVRILFKNKYGFAPSGSTIHHWVTVGGSLQPSPSYKQNSSKPKCIRIGR